MNLEGFDLDTIQALDPRTVGVVAGFLLLAFGRKLFWLFAGLVGFVFGYNFAEHLVGLPSDVGVVLVALVIGSLGSLLAVFFKKVALGIAGFLVGGLGLIWVAAETGWDTGPAIWLGAVVAGLVGALLARFVFEVALVLLSSVFGAALLVDGLDLAGVDPILLFVGLVVAGALFQTVIGRSARRRGD